MIHDKFSSTDNFDLGGHHILDWRHLDDIPQGGAVLDDVLTWDGKQWSPLPVGTTPGTITIHIDQISDALEPDTPVDFSNIDLTVGSISAGSMCIEDTLYFYNGTNCTEEYVLYSPTAAEFQLSAYTRLLPQGTLGNDARLYLGHDAGDPSNYTVGGGWLYFGDSVYLRHRNEVIPGPPTYGIETGFFMNDGILIGGNLEVTNTIWLNRDGYGSSIFYMGPEEIAYGNRPELNYSSGNEEFNFNRPLNADIVQSYSSGEIALKNDTIAEQDLYVEGNLYTDTVNEETAANGILFDAGTVLIKDGAVYLDYTGVNNGALYAYDGGSPVAASISYDKSNDQWNISHAFNSGGDYISMSGYELYINVDQRAFDPKILFGTVGSYSAQWMVFDTAEDRFELSHGLYPYSAMNEATLEPTGFVNRTDSALAFIDGTRTFRIAPLAPATEYEIWVEGVQYLKDSTEGVVIPDTEGLWFLYFDNTGTLSATQTFDADFAAHVVLCAVVYWDFITRLHTYMGDERHGVVMDGRTHAYLHLTRGTAVESGLGLGDILADESGSLDSHAQLSTGNGVIWDEDIRHEITGEGRPAELSVFYRLAAAGDWHSNIATDFPLMTAIAGRATYNEWTGAVWQQTEVGSGNFCLSHVFATNDLNKPYIVIQGQDEYNNVIDARNGAPVEITQILTDGLPVVEFATVATLIIQTSNAYSNAVKSRFRTNADGEDYTNWVDVPLTATAGAGNHFNLLNIGTYIHTEIDTHIDTAAIHIDWTGSSDNFETSGDVTGGDAYFDYAAISGDVEAADYTYPVAGVARTHVIPSMEMQTTWTGAGPNTKSNPGNNAGYLYAQAAIAATPAQWVMFYWFVPQDYKVGTTVTLDLGAGASSGSTVNYNYDIEYDICRKRSNPQAAPTNGDGRHYFSAGGISGDLVDQLLYSQTFNTCDPLTIIDGSGQINGYAVAAGDMILCQFGCKPAASGSPGTSSNMYVTHALINYTATSLKDH